MMYISTRDPHALVEVGVERADGRRQSGRDDRRIYEDHKEADKKGPQGAPGLLLSDDVPVSVPGKVFDMGNGRLLRRQGVS